MDFFGIWILMAVITAIVAASRGHNGLVFFVYGFIIWPVALVHALVAKPDVKRLEQRAIASGDSRKCPHCAEVIKAEARVCRFCGRDVDEFE